MRFWLMKSEPSTYSIDDLRRDGVTEWDGVRNFQARNFMRDAMRAGDGVLFYHSNAEPPGVAGLARVAAPAHPDLTALDPKSRYYDPKATLADPIWACVDVAFVEAFPGVVSLDAMKANPALDGLEALKRGNRLSVTPVSPAHYEEICRMALGASSRAGDGAPPRGGSRGTSASPAPATAKTRASAKVPKAAATRASTKPGSTKRGSTKRGSTKLAPAKPVSAKKASRPRER